MKKQKSTDENNDYANVGTVKLNMNSTDYLMQSSTATDKLKQTMINYGKPQPTIQINKPKSKSVLN